MNPLVRIVDSLVAAVSPARAVRRAHARTVLASYDAATPSRLRKFSRETRSGEALARLQSASIRTQARDLDRNHDLARGALTVMVNNICGPSGIGIEPQPRSVSGEILDDLSQELLDLWRDWCRFPEVTQAHSWAAVQRLMCRTWLRDGEAFAQMLEGLNPLLDHRTSVPLSLEMIEPDLVPTENEVIRSDSQAGIVRNAWGKAVSYRVFKVHPGDAFSWGASQDLKTIPAERMLHLRRTDRIGQGRGISEFASVITRLEDLKDYEESERIAAKIAASMAAYIKKGAPDQYPDEVDSEGNATPRDMRFRPGMIFDDLLPGEEIGTIDTSRPNTALQAHRDGQLRAIAAGIGGSYSSISRNYNGTYSAQRQELVEQWTHYQACAELFTSQFVQPVWERFVAIAVVSGLVKVPLDIKPGTLDDALYIGQTMPWIDPKKEADANEVLERNCYKSGPEIIRARGANPRETLMQEANWRKAKEAQGIKDAASQSAPAAMPPDAGDDTSQDAPATGTRTQ
ncbi:phage portal protein [Accumulibacter sp.]|uniref:phage portal protein n=1 Tax=Accumulibacter sp. TaxID=2053492 RepID=UPI002CAD8C2B|nr:phage portal protein [Accumulibacter sp.]HRF06334.1 phage portal protein [Accumulibacter sp.]